VARQIVTDNAVCLRRDDFSETSQTVTLFAEQTGKLSALAKGAKRPKNRSFSGGLELLTAGAAVVRLPGGEAMALLTEWQVTRTFPALRTSLSALYGGMYLAELVDRLTEPLDPHPAAYTALCRALGALGGPAPRAGILLAFEYYLLRVLGMLPNFRQCICGRTVPAGRTAPFSPHAGAIHCGHCQRPDGAMLPLSATLRAHFEALARGPVLAAAEKIPPDQAAAMSVPLRHYVTATLGRPLKTFRYLDPQRGSTASGSPPRGDKPRG
jgi:DNA repair protein RecO (recombination protein O)